MTRFPPALLIPMLLLFAGCTAPDGQQEALGTLAEATNEAAPAEASPSPAAEPAPPEPPATAAEPTPANETRAEPTPAPRPDRLLPPIFVPLDALGDGQEGAFTIDPDVTSIVVKANLRQTARGPYVLVGQGAAGGMWLRLHGPSQTHEMMLGGGAMAGSDMLFPADYEYEETFNRPDAGAWTLDISGRAVNAQVDILILERFA